MTKRTPPGEDVNLGNLVAKESLSGKASALFSPWMQMFVVSGLLTLGLSGLVWSFKLQDLITPAFIALFIGLGWISPAGRWGSIIGSTGSALLLLVLVLQPEYGFAGQVAYGIGFFLFSTMFILPVAGARSLIRKRNSIEDD